MPETSKAGSIIPSMQTPDSTIPYRIERTRNRHSRAVFQGEQIVIRLARNLSSREEQEHIESLLHRMAKSAVREQKKQGIDPFRSLLNGAAESVITLASGKTILFACVPGARTRARKTREGWRVDIGPGIHRRELHRFLWSLLSKSEESDIAHMVHTINAETLRVPVRTIRLRYALTLWGSCSHNGSISLNPALLFLPARLLRYVIIHELAHRIHRNHSRRYWATVASVLPTVQEDRKLQRNFRLTSL